MMVDDPSAPAASDVSKTVADTSLCPVDQLTEIDLQNLETWIDDFDTGVNFDNQEDMFADRCIDN